MKHLLCPTTYEQVLQEDPWECFLCATNNKPRPSFDSIIKPRANWKDKMINMFRTKSNPQQLVKRYQEKKKIRVLSLFDGLGTGAALRFYSFFSAKKLGTWSSHGLPIFPKDTCFFRFTGTSQVRFSRGHVLRERDRPGCVNGDHCAFW